MQYLARDVAAILEKPAAYVAQVGQVIQPHQPAHGRGYRAEYSFKNIVEIALYDTLNKFGVPRKFIKEHLINLGKSRYRWLEHDGKDGWVLLDSEWRWSAGHTPNHTIVNLDQSSPVTAAIVVDLGRIKNTIRQKLNMEVRELC